MTSEDINQTPQESGVPPPPCPLLGWAWARLKDREGAVAAADGTSQDDAVPAAPGLPESPMQTETPCGCGHCRCWVASGHFLSVPTPPQSICS